MAIPSGSMEKTSRAKDAELPSDYPTAGQLLEAIEALLHWNKLSINSNQGGSVRHCSTGTSSASIRTKVARSGLRDEIIAGPETFDQESAALVWAKSEIEEHKKGLAALEKVAR